MNHLRELIHRLRAGESQRSLAKDLSMSRTTVSKYRARANASPGLKKEPQPGDVSHRIGVRWNLTVVALIE